MAHRTPRQFAPLASDTGHLRAQRHVFQTHIEIITLQDDPFDCSAAIRGFSDMERRRSVADADRRGADPTRPRVRHGLRPRGTATRPETKSTHTGWRHCDDHRVCSNGDALRQRRGSPRCRSGAGPRAVTAIPALPQARPRAPRPAPQAAATTIWLALRLHMHVAAVSAQAVTGPPCRWHGCSGHLTSWSSSSPRSAQATGRGTCPKCTNTG